MYCIVPLAGPDFASQECDTPKPLIEINGKPLIEFVLKERPWYLSGELKNENIIFVLRQTPMTNKVILFLKQAFLGCCYVQVKDVSRGALLSAIAGVSQIQNFKVPLCVDLADITYSWHDYKNLSLDFKNDNKLGGIIPYFESNYEKYSYLDMSGGFVKCAAEKKVISKNASAGTYFFRDTSVFLNAASLNIANEKLYSYKNSIFLCPVFNNIITAGFSVKGRKVELLKSISKMVHEKSLN